MIISLSFSPFNLQAPGVRDQYHSDQCRLDDFLLTFLFWKALKQHNSAINSSSISTYLPPSGPEGIALTPYGQMVWLQSANSICPVS